VSEIRFKVRVELIGYEGLSEKALIELAERYTINGEREASALDVHASHLPFRPSVITFETIETGYDWPEWLGRILADARDTAGKTCNAVLYLTQVETTNHEPYRMEAVKLPEYVVEIPTVHVVRRKVTAKDQAEAIEKAQANEGVILSAAETLTDPSRWSVTLFEPEELAEAA
jgi:hypothetical protein